LIFRFIFRYYDKIKKKVRILREAIRMKIPEPSKRYTYQDYRNWEGRWELLKGVPYNMSPVPSPQHQRIVGELYFALRSFFGKKTCEVFVAPFDIRLSEIDDYENPDTVVQPDISVIFNPQQIDEKGGKGSPSMVIEVLSPSTALKDRNEKFQLYESFGVKEYWIVDPIHQTIEVYGLVEKAFSKRAVFGKQNTLSSFLFPELKIDLKEIFEQNSE
jgi:Uma2 family endonuclease